MSSFQLNLASLTLGAKEHLARLDASAGGTFQARLQSPLAAAGAAVPPPAVGAAVTFVSPSVGGVAGLASVGLEGGADVAGEYFLSGGVPSGLTAFIMTPELISSLCCGAVAGGSSSVRWGAPAAPSALTPRKCLF
jgi:hypothetical protein